MKKITELKNLTAALTIPADALAFVLGADERTENGRYEFGDGCYVNVTATETSCAHGPMEAHEVYIDVQVLLAGEERIYYAPKDMLTVTKPYDEAGDYALYAWEQAEAVDYTAGQAVILPPCDAHQPCRAVGEPMRVKKAIIKVKV